MQKLQSRLIMTVEQMKDNNAWLDMRKQGIGGSEASIVCGMNRWKSPHALWMEKTGRMAPEDLSDNEYIYWGHVLEQAVADRFCELTGRKVRKCGLMQSNKYPFVLASVDRLVVGENAGLECKTTASYNAEEWKDDNVPDAYYLQCQHYMLATGLEKWYIAVLIGGNKFVWKTIERNEDDIQAILKMEKSFWAMVQNDIEPPVDGSASCAAELLSRYPGGKTEPVQLDNLMQGKAAELMELKAQEKGLKLEIAKAENEIKAALGDNEAAYAGKFFISWKSAKPRQTVDSKLLKANYPEAYAACLKTGAPTRRFSVKLDA